MSQEELEQQILGQVLLDFTLVDKLLALLNEEDFSNIKHKELYKVFKRLSQSNTSDFNLADLYATYPKAIENCGGIVYLSELLSYVITTNSFDSNIKALLKLSTISNLEKVFDKSKALFNKDFDEGLSFIESNVQSLTDRLHKNDAVDLYKTFIDSMNKTEDINVNLGFKQLHDVLGYPHPGELIIMGARPGMGKTAFALACLFNYICKNKKRAVMFSLEMSGSELFNRMVSSVSNISLQDIRSHKLNADQRKILNDNAKELASNPYLSLYDKTVSNIPSLRTAIRKEAKKGEVGLVVVDYLQLITATGNNNYEKVSEISRQLKLIAREFNCTVVALSQLSRKVEERADKRPQLSDLRESGSIEQDADYVLFLYRHNYYEKDPSVDPTKDPLNIEVAKNRHGKTGTIQLEFNLTTGRFK